MLILIDIRRVLHYAIINRVCHLVVAATSIVLRRSVFRMAHDFEVINTDITTLAILLHRLQHFRLMRVFGSSSFQFSIHKERS
jgi:hypothetical protein